MFENYFFCYNNLFIVILLWQFGLITIINTLYYLILIIIKGWFCLIPYLNFILSNFCNFIFDLSFLAMHQKFFFINIFILIFIIVFVFFNYLVIIQIFNSFCIAFYYCNICNYYGLIMYCIFFFFFFIKLDTLIVTWKLLFNFLSFK